MFSLQMRAVLVDWLVEVQVQLKLLQVKCTSYQSISQGDLTTTILMSCVTGDSVKRHLYRRPVPCRGGALGHEVQAAAGGRGRHVPGLQVEEVFAPACSDFVYITDHAYTEDAIKQMEIKILQTLKFSLFEPLSIHFLRRFSKAGDVDVLQHSLAKYAIELALVEYDLVPVPGSKLAASALCLSLMLLEPKVSVPFLWL